MVATEERGKVRHGTDFPRPFDQAPLNADAIFVELEPCTEVLSAQGTAEKQKSSALCRGRNRLVRRAAASAVQIAEDPHGLASVATIGQLQSIGTLSLRPDQGRSFRSI